MLLSYYSNYTIFTPIDSAVHLMHPLYIAYNPRCLTPILSYMEDLSRKVKFGEEDFANPKNQDKMREFAERDDFDEVFQTLREHENELHTFGNAMQYIRNVVNCNQTTWSMQPCR